MQMFSNLIRSFSRAGIVGQLATLALGAMFALVIVGSAQATAAAAFTFSARPGSVESK
jgi:hypothetical protein